MPPVDDRGFADALREAIDTRGLSLDRIRAHLLSYGHDVSVATLSYWQTGRSIPVRRASLQALGSLEVILRVPRGSLARRLPSQQGRRATATHGWTSGWGEGADVAVRIAEELGVPWMEGTIRISQEEILRIGPDRSVIEHRIADLIVAEEDGYQRLLIAYFTDFPGVLFTVTAERGCRVGRVATDLAETLTVAELILDQPLRAGEPYHFEHSIAYDHPVTLREWQRNHSNRLRDASVEIKFHPDDPPDRLEVYVGPPAEPIPYARRTLMHSSVVLHEADFGPGSLAAQWGWADDPDDVIQPLIPLTGEDHPRPA